MFPRRLVLTIAASTLLAACGNGSFGGNSASIANGGIVVRGEQVVLHGTGGIDGKLDAAGNLAVDGTAVTIDAAQREQLKQYYLAAHAVRDHGIATGKAGAALALKSVKAAAAHVVGGNGAATDAELDAASTRVDREASKICLQLQQIKTAQERLAATLAAFKPFAHIVGQVDTCSARD